MPEYVRGKEQDDSVYAQETSGCSPSEGGGIGHTVCCRVLTRAERFVGDGVALGDADWIVAPSCDCQLLRSQLASLDPGPFLPPFGMLHSSLVNAPLIFCGPCCSIVSLFLSWAHNSAASVLLPCVLPSPGPPVLVVIKKEGGYSGGGGIGRVCGGESARMRDRITFLVFVGGFVDERVKINVLSLPETGDL